jgi:hypothetical protein
MPEPRHSINSSNVIGEVPASWIIALLAVAIGVVLLLVLQEPGTDDRSVPWW